MAKKTKKGSKTSGASGKRKSGSAGKKRAKKKGKSRSKSTVVVLGASGYVGQATVGALGAKGGVRVIATTRDGGSEKADALRAAGAEVVEVDLGSAKAVAQVVPEGATVFVVTPGSKDRGSLAKAALKGAKKAGAGHVVVVSVPMAGKKTVFGKQFKRVERATKEAGLPFTILRLPWFLENELGNAASIKAQGSVFGYLKPKAKYAPVSVGDAGKAAANVLAAPAAHAGETYTLGGTVTTPQKLVKAYTKAGKKAGLGKVSYVQVDADAVKEALLGFGMPEWQADGALEVLEDINAGVVTENTDLPALLGDDDAPLSIADFAKAVVGAVAALPSASSSGSASSSASSASGSGGSSASASGSSSASGSGSGSDESDSYDAGSDSS